jgi:Sulfatase
MTKTINKIFLVVPHSILAVIFFVLHDVNENFGLIPLNLFMKYLGLYLGLCIILLCISFLLFREKIKAFIYATLVLCMFFSFGAGQDKLKSMALPGWISSYTVILSGTILLFVVVAHFLKRSKRDFSALNQYLQVFFSVVTFIELFGWCYYCITHHELNNEFGDSSKKLSHQYQPCDTCLKPDIYFIVFDGYSSSKCLKRNFGFDNSGVDTFLENEGFFVSKDSKSNYALTPLSIASTFNLNYLRPDLRKKKVDGKLLVQGLVTVYNSELPVALEKEGYEIHNYSIFNLRNYPVYSEQHAKFRDAMIHLQTIAGRVNRDIGWKIAAFDPFWTKAAASAQFEYDRKTRIQRYITGNLQKLESAIQEKNGGPKFVYAHLVIPHDPYFFDEKGNFNPQSIVGNRLRPELYVKQLIYSNSYLRRVVHELMNDTTRKKIIIIEGDHGFREYSDPAKMPDIFCNLNAYYFPDKDYHLLYDSISPVNSFRVILNKYFHKNFSLLPDRCVYIKTPNLAFEQTKH